MNRPFQFALTFCALSLGISACAPRPQAPPLASVDGQLLYTAETEDDQNIFVINADGTGLVNLTQSVERPVMGHLGFWSPAWSPDGQWITFDSDQAAPVPALDHSYRMAADGRNPTLLAADGYADQQAQWSPDGTRLVTACRREQGAFATCLLNTDGTGRQILRDTFDFPAWSPDGTQLAFNDSAQRAIFVMTLAEGTRRKIVEVNNGEASVAWSPDGTQLAYRKNHAQTGWPALFVIHADGTGETQLTDWERKIDDPTWAPDGRAIVFEADLAGELAIYKINVDGTDQVRLTPMRAYSPVWSPDGTRIAFVARVNDITQIFVMNADGSVISQLTWEAGYKEYITWRP